MDKAALLRELLEALGRELATSERAHAAAREGATHDEARPEHDKDTRAIEQSYLARGQAQRIVELRTAVAELARLPARDFGEDDPIAVGALVTLEDQDTDERSRILLAPHGGGTLLAAGTVRVITPGAPLGIALIGRRLDEDCTLRLENRERTFLIVELV